MVRLTGNSGNNILRGSEFDDRIDAGSGNDYLYGFGGADRLRGESGSDRLFGGSGNDELEGGSGNDFLYGGLGRDVLEGGTGNDLLAGGGGADQFKFEINAGRDVIADFQDGVDRLKIDTDTVNGMRDLRISHDLLGNAVVSWDTGSVTLIGISAAQLTSADFLF